MSPSDVTFVRAAEQKYSSKFAFAQWSTLNRVYFCVPVCLSPGSFFKCGFAAWTRRLPSARSARQGTGPALCLGLAPPEP